MFVYIVRAESCSYDEYDEVTVIAKTEDHALLLASSLFDKSQFPLKAFFICRCDHDEEALLTASFNAG